MSFDLRPHLKLDPWYWQTSQKARADVNWNENCVPTSFALCCLAYGVNPGDPQAWTDFEYSSSYHGVEGFAQAIDYIEKHFPGAPAISLQNPSRDQLPAMLQAAGESGMAMVSAFYIDCATVTIGAGTDCGHASLPVAFDGTRWTILNVWDGRQQQFTTDELKRIYIGGVAVFEEPLWTPAPPSTHEEEDMQLIQAGDGSRHFPAGPATVYSMTAQDTDVHGAIWAFDAAGKTTYFADHFDLAGAKTTGHGPQTTTGTLGGLGMKAGGSFAIQLSENSGPVVLSLR